MSAEEADGVQENGKEIDESSAKKTVKHDSGAADLEKVTDYAEEKDVVSGEQFKRAMSIIGDRRNKEVAEKKAKENELMKVSISKEDVDLIVQQVEVPRSVAERTLREHRGDLITSLMALTE